MYLFRFAYSIIQQTAHILSSRKKEIIWATAFIRSLENSYNGQLDDFTFKKITHRYAVYNPMMCDAFTSLQSRYTNRQERERMLLYFICSVLFDDFSDEQQLTKDELYRISFEPETWQASTIQEKIFLYAHGALADYVSDKNAYRQVTQQLYDAQIASAQQFDPAISQDTLHRITFDKGGFAVLLCHFYLDHEAGEAERNCWYQIGTMIQLTNDIYDIHKDLQQGLITLPNSITNAYTFNDFFRQLVAQLKAEIHQLPFPVAAKQQFMISMMGMCSLGQLGIKRLMQLQGNQEKLPDLRIVPRKRLIVDMENPANLWRCVRQVYRDAKF
ncbi:hypothetical protein [Chitinophaga sp. MM2321]|uniref:hypothetical protein n=1 Tax=Chitinophaga sp. MM2321 TaxID=3137178 RepID=UPI0032D572BD